MRVDRFFRRFRERRAGPSPRCMICAAALAIGAIAAGRTLADEPASSMHWAFRPVDRPPLPTPSTDAPPPRNAIDAFVVAKLRENGLALSPEADRRTLIRRLYFDVIGLPPTPEEIEHFASDCDSAAYEKLVDRLLASPAFGERWARRWLDVARFAESHGFEMNQPRPNAWPYRDYVIAAFNRDLPYDRFIVEQIAGDAVGADAATAFLVGGPWDQVKSPDPVLTAQQRADELHDMTSTVGAVFLGLTVGCARCHHHKFDPISQADYYAIQAALAGVSHGERIVPADDWPGRRQEIERVRRQLARLALQSARRQPLADSGIERPPVSRGENIDRFAPVEARFLRFTIQQTDAGAQPCLDELEVFTADDDAPRNVALASAETKLRVSSTLPGHAIHQPRHINDGLYGNEHSWISDEAGQGWVELEFADPVVIDCVLWGRDRGWQPRYDDRIATQYEIAVSLDGQAWRTVASSADRRPFARLAAIAAAEIEAGEAGEWRARLATLAEEQKIYAGVFTQPAKTYRLHRGDPMQRREEIAPGGLSKLGGGWQLKSETPDQERRLALARWIASKENRLTARVIVNRLWQGHFGEGIVSTPSDFGVNGTPPSHVELLDWLAAELMSPSVSNQPPWSLKHMHRLILLSATYRQASRAEAGGLARDAQARLLWRFPPRRLDAEAIRDRALAVSGRLDRTMGGPGFDLFEPNSNYVKVYTPKREFGPETFRRMIYQSKPRMQLDDTFGAFDCPDAGQMAPRRGRSTTPLQALNLLNSPFMTQQSGFFAERVAREAGGDPRRQVERAFLLALGRQPVRDEADAAVQLAAVHGLPALCRALFNANEFVMLY